MRELDALLATTRGAARLLRALGVALDAVDDAWDEVVEKVAPERLGSGVVKFVVGEIRGVLLPDFNFDARARCFARRADGVCANPQARQGCGRVCVCVCVCVCV